MIGRVLLLSWAVIVLPGCSSRACTNAVVSAQRNASGVSLHYDMRVGCVSVTHDLTGINGAIASAQASLASWSAVAGMPVCFTTLTGRLDAPEDPADRRIHFELSTTQPVSASVRSYSNDDTGVISHGIIDLGYTALPSNPEMVRLVGLALGLSGAPGGASSVMASPVVVAAPTADDVDAISKLYDATCLAGH